jgi:dihydrofolate synthase/folylpolyglutamate synthase
VPPTAAGAQNQTHTSGYPVAIASGSDLVDPQQGSSYPPATAGVTDKCLCCFPVSVLSILALMTFKESLHYLLSLGHETIAIKLGLRNTELLLAALGNPHEAFESVQIAGTNGKGSTAVILDSICRAAGIRAGLYTSPHLVSVTERIKIAGAAVSEADFAKYASEVRAAAEDLVGRGQLEALPTFFEHLTAIAILAFKAAGVRLAILETGMGGRLDATTVAGAATVAITPLALDHQQYLGTTLEEIAFEKAAIIRPGVTAIIAPQTESALEVILKRAAEVHVIPVIIDEAIMQIHGATADGHFTVTFETHDARYENVELGLRGRHQIVNAAVAICLAECLRDRACEIPAAAIIAGVEQAQHGGRLELHEGRPSILFDGAHNPSGAAALRAFLDEFVKGPLTIVFGAMNDKQLDEVGEFLFPAADKVVLTKPNNPRAADLDVLQKLAGRFVQGENLFATSSVSEAIQRAKAITPPGGMICITGSLYLIGEIKALIKSGETSQVAN